MPNLRRCLVLAASFGVLLAAPAALEAQVAFPTPPPCLADQNSFTATGSVQTFTVPQYATAILIVAVGGSGGSAAGAPGTGGYAAHVEASVPVAPGTVLSVVVGAQGASGGDTGGSGGGGGSFVFAGGTLLVAAGGGGGAGYASNGADAGLYTTATAGGGTYGGSAGTGGNGGVGGTNPAGGNGGAGGGFLSAGGDGDGSFPGLGGHRISSPGDAAAGAGGGLGAAGGFGGGGGGGTLAGGGGGGYNGGGGGDGGAGGGGGGSSFVAANGTINDLYQLNTAGDGSVTICVTQYAPPVPVLSQHGLAVLVLALLLAGGVLLLRRLY
jgi:hypothetical protein